MDNTTIPEAGVLTPESGLELKTGGRFPGKHFWIIKKNKEILRREMPVVLVPSVHCYLNVDAFR